MRKSICLLFAWLFLCCISTGCGGAAKSSEELNIAVLSAPQTMDPQLVDDMNSSFAIHLMSGSLFSTNEEKELTPCLAKDYEVSEDGLTYTIHLKENLKWSDGSPLTAEDFVCALQRVADPDVGSGSVFLITDSCVIKNAREVNAGELPVNMLGVFSPDHETLVVELEAPCPYFLKLLEKETFSPCSVDFYHSVGDNYAKNPQSILSSGPYILDKYEPLATQIHFVKNPYYVEADKITIPGITLQVIANQQQALMCFNTGSVDATKVNGALLELAEGDEKLQVFPFAGVYYVYINQKDNPALKNRHIRQALSMSIDRESFVKNILRQGNTAMQRAVPPGFYIESDGSDFSGDSQRYIINSIPTLVVVTLLMLILKPGIWSIIFALMLSGWIQMSRIARVEVLKAKEMEYVQAARTMGASHMHIMFREIAPNIIGRLMTQIMLSIPSAVFMEAFLSFVGLGMPAGTCSLGLLLSEGFSNALLHPYKLIFPALIMILLMVGCHLVADGIKNASD